MRFDQTPEGQQQARQIVEAAFEGDRMRSTGVPLYHDAHGPVYRVLLGGFRWEKYALSAYAASDGERSWQVGLDVGGKTWGAVLFTESADPEIVGDGYRTMREAREACEARARRMRWTPGAPW